MVSLGVGAVVAYGAHRAYLHATTSSTFAIEAVDIAGVDRCSADEVNGLAGVSLGDNLIQLDADVVRTRVEQHPWVRSAKVTRRWPRRLAIEVVEHVPVALVALGHLYYADAEGNIVKRRAPSERPSLPVVTGLSREEIEHGDGRGRARLVRALGFLDDLSAELAGDAPAVEEIHIDRVMGLSFVPLGVETRVHVGHAPWRGRIKRWAAVNDMLEKRHVVASEVALQGTRHPERVVARLPVAARN